MKYEGIHGKTVLFELGVDLSDESHAVLGMSFYEPHLGFVELLRLVQHGFGNLDLADVVEKHVHDEGFQARRPPVE